MRWDDGRGGERAGGGTWMSARRRGLGWAPGRGWLLAAVALVTLALGVAGWSAPAGAADDARTAMARVVWRLRVADYEGNQERMQAQFEALAPWTDTDGLAARAHYWRGFAQWRRAINGFNDSLGAAELEGDLNRAVEEFRAAFAADTTLADAQIGEVSSLGYLMFLHRQELPRLKELAGQMGPVLKRLRATAADNPRFIWVEGPMLWQRTPEQGGGPAKAMEGYRRGLALIRAGTGRSKDPLDPSWGEPELLMNLAWSQLNAPTPDPVAAEKNARAALKLVPNWHYVRDILMKQIAEARTQPRG